MPSLSRTAAKRQAHGESHLRRSETGTGCWTVCLPTGWYVTRSFAAARRELAAWRAARVRELMGERSDPLLCGNCGKPVADHCLVHLLPCCPGKCPGTSKILAPPSAPEARGDSTSRGGKGGSSLPEPGSIVTLTRPCLDDNNDTLPAGLDVVFLEEVAPGVLLVDAEDEEGNPVDARIREGDWHP